MSTGSASALSFLRSPLVLCGLLLLSIGLAETVAGRAKIDEYEAILRSTPAAPPTDPAALFPTASEEQERHELAQAKLAYYHLLVTAGQLLTGLGLLLFAAGLLRAGQRTPRGAPERTASH